MKKASRIIWGILVLALGVILFGNAAKLWDVTLFFDGWWAALVMLLALFSICTDKPNIVNVYFLLFGGVMLFKEQGIYIAKDTSSWLIALALLIAVAGISIIIRAAFGSKKKITTIDANEFVSSEKETTVSFGEETIRFDGTTFESGNYSVAFGELTVDLRTAIIAENATLYAKAAFGELKVLLPTDVNADVDGSTFLGEIDTPQSGGEKTLKIKASATFGQISIRK